MRARSRKTAQKLPPATPAPPAALGDENYYWAAVQARDRSFDDRIYYSVATTGIYCRPSCPARRPRRENVAFHATCRDAEAAGFRPCRRCQPNAPSLQERTAAKVAAACRLIEAAEDTPTLATLAAAAGVSADHFHHMFKAATGVTPKAYATAQRRKRLHDAMRSTNTVTEAIHDAGFNSTSRFYAQAPDMLGMAPSAFRAGGAAEEIRFAVGECALGAILVAASAKGIAAVLLGTDPDELICDLEERFPKAVLIGADPAFEQVVAKVVGLVQAPGLALDLPLDVRGTAFQHRVWQALRAIPPGTTATYSEIADAIGLPKAVRAVAAACAANKIAIAIPCHRVVRSDGSLSGYRWGVERKKDLIEREAQAVASAKPSRSQSRRTRT